ncbi:MAG: hypothetical protein PHU06_06010 [Gallionella sp.]|nr:hypothetical protein [Gallionella sp.]MDD4958406.1 hypothetical protein [Gallionella sp.]
MQLPASCTKTELPNGLPIFIEVEEHGSYGYRAVEIVGIYVQDKRGRVKPFWRALTTHEEDYALDHTR